jgi:hypothetical protein
MIRSHDKFQQIARDIVYLNLTLHGQSDLYTDIRQLELSLLQLTQQLEELFNSIQFAILGTLPIKLISPTVLQNILRNVSLQLPDGYELIAGTRTEDLHMYYELVKVSLVANMHSVQLSLYS